MKTRIENLIESVKALPEIDLQELFEGLHDHITKNNLSHVIHSCYGTKDDLIEIDNLELKINELKDETESLEGDVNDLKEKIYDVEGVLDTFEFDGDPETAVDQLIKEIKSALK